MTEINYLERFSTSFKNLSFFITLSNFLTPKRVLKLYNYKEKLKTCALFFASIIKFLLYLSANKSYSSLLKTYNQPWSTTAKRIVTDISALQCRVHCKFNLFDHNRWRHYALRDKPWSVRCTNQNKIAIVLVLVVLLIIQQEELMKWHPSGVTRTRIRVIEVNFSEMSIKVKEI